MLDIGAQAPRFSVKATDGRALSNETLAGKPYVLYFFPKSFTRGCTIETKQFQDAYPDLQALGVEVVGVSSDAHETQCEFAKSTGAAFPMVGDAKGEMLRSFDVRWPILGVAQRVTYVVDAEGTVRGAFRHELDVKRHLADVRSCLERLAPKA
jgi:peroxiredoxin